jgi:hypothetical protein
MMTADRIVCQHNVALSVSADGEFMFFHGCLISQNYSFALASPGRLEMMILSLSSVTNNAPKICTWKAMAFMVA